MSNVVGVLLSCVLFGWAHVVVRDVCRRNAAIRPWRETLIGAVWVWFAWIIFKLAIIVPVWQVGDCRVHEMHARVYARSIAMGAGVLSTDKGTLVGNHFYRALWGGIYAVTDAPWFFPYIFNGFAACCGLILLLEAICRGMQCTRLPRWIVLFVVLVPSAVFWTTENLKEGLMLWGICMVVRFCADPAMDFGSPFRVGASMVGLLIAVLMRPHVAIACFIPLLLPYSNPKRPGRTVLTLTMIVVAWIGGLATFKALKPGVIENMMEGDVIESLEEGYRNNVGGSAIIRQSAPIPVLSGLFILLFEPTPFRWSSVSLIAAGLEAFVFTGLLIVGWIRVRNRLVLLSKPVVLSSAFALLGLAFFFSYIYNVGYASRQRVQALPALLVLLTAPYLTGQSLNRGRQRRCRDLFQGDSLDVGAQANHNVMSHNQAELTGVS